MKKWTLLLLIIFILLTAQIHAQTPSHERDVTFPWLPRVTAYEAYIKYKEGKVIIFHAGGEHYNKRHILGAFNLDFKDDVKDKLLAKFPKEGIEIFTYCYWSGETGSASVADYMIKKGFKDVKIVKGKTAEGGGAEMEKFFEYYKGGKIVNPITGKVTIIKQ